MITSKIKLDTNNKPDVPTNNGNAIHPFTSIVKPANPETGLQIAAITYKNLNDILKQGQLVIETVITKDKPAVGITSYTNHANIRKQ